MKKIFYRIVNVFPLFIWIGWFLLAVSDVDTDSDLGIIQLLLLFALPLLYSLCNAMLSNNKKEFTVNNTMFGVSQIFGYYLAGLLYYSYISSDSKTVLVINTLSGVSILYISIVTLIFYGIRSIIDKVKNK